jgi:bifunctional non-homologous end joining protein LigD
MSPSSLQRYQEMRDFSITPEPKGLRARSSGELRYYIQRHDATRLHYDFRLELDGVLKSWAVPRGPSLDPRVKRLAVEVEDHPLEYGEFEGTIPEQQYGAGDVLLWDKGRWTPEDDDAAAALKKGRLHFRLDGEKLRGRWVLTRTFSNETQKKPAWLLIKRDDDEARHGEDEIVEQLPESVKRAPAAEKRPRKPRRAKEAASEVMGIRITHPERPVWQDERITKLDLARYYEAVGQSFLPHVKNRLLTIVRCPDGAGGKCFYQRHLKGKRGYFSFSSLEQVIGAVQIGAIEFHTWGATVDDAARPDRFTLDLDPGPGVAWKRLVEAARLAKTLLDRLGLASFLKTTGGKGLHIVVPVEPELGWDDVKGFTKAIADFLVRAHPGLFVANMAKSRRRGKVFVDYLRNGETASAVAAFSVRARPGATVSMPLAWRELRSADLRNRFTVKTAPKRKDDPWKDYARTKQRITPKMRRALAG